MGPVRVIYDGEDTGDAASKAPPARPREFLSYLRPVGGWLWSEPKHPYGPTPATACSLRYISLPGHGACHDAGVP